MNYSPKCNKKVISKGGKPQTQNEKDERDTQFLFIERTRIQYENQNNPVISIDTKKKEMIGNFANKGKTWAVDGTATYDHDFRTYASGIAIPFGIYDCIKNIGRVFVGTSYDTAKFEVDSLVKWWLWYGKYEYPHASKILILSDAGGSSGYRTKLWKVYLQKNFCDRYHIQVMVCHYSPGASKWNPIEHRLFSEISKNWAGQPLINYEMMLNYIRTTSTQTGLSANAYLVNKEYAIGQKANASELSSLNIQYPCCGNKLNYVISPIKKC